MSSTGIASVPPSQTHAGKIPAGLSGVFGRLGPHMAALDTHLHEQLASFEPEIRAMADYCIDTSGKRLRPALVFFSGWRAGVVQDELVRASAVVELVHLATLVHDDIMDEADVRRNRQTASRKYGPTAAVLLGDALFSHALHLATRFPTTEVCAVVSESTRRVCAGEIVQTLRRGTLNINRADYQRIVDLKTAELFRASCFLGARLAGHGEAFVTAASTFGRHLGIAYQIYDDLVDFFGDETSIGKTLGTDLASGKLTLPLLELSDRLPPKEAEALRQEVSGAAPVQPELRLRQMRELGVFPAVADQVRQELALGWAALRGHEAVEATPLLMELSQLLVRQVETLGVGR
jgi:octaprenyl-diphosphate synthase